MKKISLILAFVLILSGSALATVRYVSNTATNGYAVGNDSNDGLSKSTPLLTMTKAESDLIAGDTIYVNGGTYEEDDGAGYRCFVSSKLADWIADGDVIVQANPAANRVVEINANVATTYAGFTFDGENTKATGLSIGNSDGSRTFINCVVKDVTGDLVSAGEAEWNTFTNCSFIDSGGLNRVFFGFSGAGTLVVTNPTISITGAVSEIFRIEETGTSDVTITNATVNASGITNDVFRFRGDGDLIITSGTWNVSGYSFLEVIQVLKTGSITVTGADITYDTKSLDEIINITGGTHVVEISDSSFHINATDQYQTVINIVDQPTPEISGNTFDVLTTGFCTQVSITSTGTAVGAAEITDNIFKSRTTSGYIVRIGTEATGAADDQINGVIFSGNITYGSYFYNPDDASTTHGVLFGFNTGLVFEKNRMQGCHYSLVVKHNGSDNTPGYVAKNILFQSGSTYGNSLIYAKGMSGVDIYNNSLILKDSTVSPTALVQISKNGVGEESSNCTLKNNIIYGGTVADKRLLSIDTGALVGFTSDYNNFYGVGNSFSVEESGSTYAEYVLATSQESHSIVTDPKILSSGKLKKGSPCLAVNNAGTAIAGVNGTGTTDLLGNAGLDGSIPIGAYFGSGVGGNTMLNIGRKKAFSFGGFLRLGR